MTKASSMSDQNGSDLKPISDQNSQLPILREAVAGKSGLSVSLQERGQLKGCELPASFTVNSW